MQWQGRACRVRRLYSIQVATHKLQWGQHNGRVQTGSPNPFENAPTKPQKTGFQGWSLVSQLLGPGHFAKGQICFQPRPRAGRQGELPSFCATRWRIYLYNTIRVSLVHLRACSGHVCVVFPEWKKRALTVLHQADVVRVMANALCWAAL